MQVKPIMTSSVEAQANSVHPKYNRMLFDEKSVGLLNYKDPLRGDLAGESDDAARQWPAD